MRALFFLHPCLQKAFLLFSCCVKLIGEEGISLKPRLPFSLRVGHDRTTSLILFTFMHWRRKWQPTPVFLPGEAQGRGSLVGCHLWSRTESDTKWLSSSRLPFLWLPASPSLLSSIYQPFNLLLCESPIDALWPFSFIHSFFCSLPSTLYFCYFLIRA